ncbi:MAG: PIN domain-containing protein [Pirellulales bacterium]|nr:PIN domain-containing protein [Pirellulales bacterium]
MLLDTSGLLCYLDASEQRHPRAIELYDSARVRVTHNYVIAEFVALAQARGYPRQLALEFADVLASTSEIETVWVNASLHQEALALVRAQLDKSYSLCDAVSFVVMNRRNLTDALSTDHHFTQAGFQALLIA